MFEELPAGEGHRRDAKEGLVAIEQPAAPAIADGVAERAPEGASAGGYNDDPSEMKSMLGVGKKAGEEERGLSRDGTPACSMSTAAAQYP